jgi:hypothetical protein
VTLDCIVHFNRSSYLLHKPQSFVKFLSRKLFLSLFEWKLIRKNKFSEYPKLCKFKFRNHSHFMLPFVEQPARKRSQFSMRKLTKPQEGIWIYKHITLWILRVIAYIMMRTKVGRWKMHTIELGCWGRITQQRHGRSRNPSGRRSSSSKSLREKGLSAAGGWQEALQQSKGRKRKCSTRWYILCLNRQDVLKFNEQ